MKHKLVKLAIIVSGLIAAQEVSADTLFTFSTAKGSISSGLDTNVISVSLAPGLTGPATVWGVTNCAATLGRFFNDSWAGFSVFGTGSGNGTAAATAANFTTLGQYTFTISTNSGTPLLYLSSLTFLGARGGSSGTRGFEVFVDVNGVNDFNNDLVTNVPNSSLTAVKPSTQSFSIDLSAARYQGVGSITVRFIPLTTSSQTVEFSGFTVNGGIGAVPTPPPVLTQNTLPSCAQTVVGDQVVFTAAFSNSPAVNLQWLVVTNGVTNSISGATTGTLALNNLQTNDSGIYLLRAINATNSSLISYSTGATLTVSDIPASANNVIAAFAAQCGLGSAATSFTPGWTINTDNDLLLGGYSDVGNGNFGLNGCANNPNIFTDGSFGYQASDTGGSPTLNSCGDNAGQYVTYTLPYTTYGYDVTNITVYGGWGNGSHDRQRYSVTYSTVDAPNTFFHLADVTFNPTNPNGVQAATRSVLTSPNGPLARSVYAIRFSFNVGNNEGGYAGYSELMAFGQPSPQVPDLTQDVVPATIVTYVGDNLTLFGAFANATSYQWQKNGTNIPGATSATLTLNNVQLTDTATNSGYGLVASNASGAAFSSVCAVTIAPVSVPTPNVSTAISAQSQWPVNNVSYTPDWLIDPNSLVANQLPGSTNGNFNLENEPLYGIDRNISTLTDTYTSLAIVREGSPTTTSPNYLTCGNGNGSGSLVIYELTNSATGYNLTNITVYGGWADGARDQQAYTVSYATVTDPTNFTVLSSVSYNPTGVVGMSVTRVQLIPVVGSLATNVVAVKFDFTTPTSENGYCGYAKITMDGFVSSAPAPTPPVLNAPYASGGNLILTGSGGTPNASYTWLTTTSLAAPIIWTTSSSGMLDGAGAFSNAIPIIPSQPQTFFRMRLP